MMRNNLLLLLVLAALVTQAQSRYLVPSNVPFDASPDQPNAKITTVLTYSIDADGNKVPVKILRITNNAGFTVYPIMRDGNEAKISTGNTGLYDPYDPTDMEYRGYIGYKDTDGKYCFGLQPGQTIAVRIPLVFWNAARIGIMTAGEYLTPAPGTPNPMGYHADATCVMTAAESDTNSIRNGIVMWYKGTLGAPLQDTPDQLAEWTVRDEAYLSNPKITNRTKGEIPKSEKVDLINYDVSYVDNLYLPLAIEAPDVPEQFPKNAPEGINPAAYGWIGSTQLIDSIQTKIGQFIASGNTYLGNYFGGNGWPFYYIPRVPTVKIPSGANIFEQSPLGNQRSSYSQNHYPLSSGDTLPILIASIGAEGNLASGYLLQLSSGADVNLVKKLKPGYLVTGHPPGSAKNPISAGTTIKSIKHISTGIGDPSVIELDQPLQTNENGSVFDFTRSVTDYASAALTKLWYSWAKYYIDHSKNTPPVAPVPGAVQKDEAFLRFNKPVEGLKEGMLVTGPGIDNADKSRDKAGVIILAVADDKKSVLLSQLATGTYPTSPATPYSFQNPQLPNMPTDVYTLDFSKEKPEVARDPVAFAQKAYLIMASMAQVPHDPAKIYSLQLMSNVIGGNMGFIFSLNGRPPLCPDAILVTATIRDMIKSVLRGVTDFTRFPEKDGNKRIWYPNPSESRGGLPFNAFNLDPFVWFVHVPLGLSGYGFSLDDDVADVGARGSHRLELTISGVHGLTNSDEWKIQTPYGPVTDSVFWTPGKTVANYLGIEYATNTSPIRIISPNHTRINGDTVIITGVKGNEAANGTFRVANATTDTFDLVDSKGSGACVPHTGHWTSGPLSYITTDTVRVFWKVKADDRGAGFQGARVTGPELDPKINYRVKELGSAAEGILMLNAPLKGPDGRILPERKYKLTFSGN